MQRFWKYLLFFIFILLIGVAYFCLKHIILDKAMRWIEENPLHIPLSHDPIQKDTCGLGICLVIPNASFSLLNQTIYAGDIEVGFLLKYPLTIHLDNKVSYSDENHVTASLDISRNNIQVHEMNFYLSPLQGALSGNIHSEEGILTGQVRNLRSFLQRYWNFLNPNLPIELTYFISNAGQNVELKHRNHWIFINNIPLFPIR